MTQTVTEERTIANTVVVLTVMKPEPDPTHDDRMHVPIAVQFKARKLEDQCGLLLRFATTEGESMDTLGYVDAVHAYIALGVKVFDNLKEHPIEPLIGFDLAIMQCAMETVARIIRCFYPEQADFAPILSARLEQYAIDCPKVVAIPA